MTTAPDPSRGWRARLHDRLPARRVWLKTLHAAMIPMFIWFLVMTPARVLPFGPAAFRAHSMLALVFVSLVLFWYADYMRRGLAGRPGPKLPPLARRFHQLVHKVLIWGLFLVALSGFLLGLTSDRLLKAGGFLPIAPPLDLARANEIVGRLHVIEYYALGVIAGAHALFHVWRHLRLRDNALRIMTPKRWHRFL
ncbi:cytochrome B [Salipiger sp. IMCC34102]|uniref:cytochrome b/b6 domain-containing protein n=1 Tax=Salipiger sp. IMCC34102 TaxID=2510647 RepID=UPI00101C893F|nr:cytochrome b/b6 domain-containing protein [Salipiger sp. IMCC34102]RYH01869.1 cytochrome B [Salipiger sp. IMCC34102]